MSLTKLTEAQIKEIEERLASLRQYEGAKAVEIGKQSEMLMV